MTAQGAAPQEGQARRRDWLVAPDLAPDAADPVMAPLYAVGRPGRARPAVLRRVRHAPGA